jgi:mannose-1-phosphate guanylyltransferase
VEAGEELAPGVRCVVGFVEKPSQRAEQYVSGGRHFWNAGMFFFRADVMLAAPSPRAEIAAGVARIEAAAGQGPEAERAETARVFAELPSISIDYAVMERTAPLSVVPSSFGWNDLGSWQSAWELGDKDGDGNVAPEDSVLIDARQNLCPTSARTAQLVALVESKLCDQTDDALLVILANARRTCATWSMHSKPWQRELCEA